MMRVEFALEETWQMMQSVVDQLLESGLSKKDRAALRRWRSEEMKVTSPAMKLLTERVNQELQRAHVRSEASPLVKPDWL